MSCWRQGSVGGYWGGEPVGAAPLRSVMVSYSTRTFSHPLSFSCPLVPARRIPPDLRPPSASWLTEGERRYAEFPLTVTRAAQGSQNGASCEADGSEAAAGLDGGAAVTVWLFQQIVYRYTCYRQASSS